MMRSVVMVLAVGLLLAADAPKAGDAKKDTEGLQGTWKVVGGESKGQPVTTPAGVEFTVAFTGDRYAVTGDLTIREVTRPVELAVSVEGRIPRDAFGKERIAVSATGTLNRKDWGLNWNMALETGGFLVSDEIKLEIESAFLADAAELAQTSAA